MITPQLLLASKPISQEMIWDVLAYTVWDMVLQSFVGKVIVGNRFDGVEIHTSAITNAMPNVAVSSMGREAFAALTPEQLKRFAVIDYIAGQEKNSAYNLLPYKALPSCFNGTIKDIWKARRCTIAQWKLFGH